MLDKLTKESFEHLLDQTFRAGVEGDTWIDLKLVQVASLASASTSDDRREPFSVHFRGPNQPLLLQRMYPFEHAELGVFDLFIVPIGPNEEGLLYEAIFN